MILILGVITKKCLVQIYSAMIFPVGTADWLMAPVLKL